MEGNPDQEPTPKSGWLLCEFRGLCGEFSYCGRKYF